MTQPDFEVTGRIRVERAEELPDAFRALAGREARLCGSASTQHLLPAPRRPVVLLDTSGLARIVRLDAGDLTCSVEPGVRRKDLDAALAEHRLCLPCGGAGTLGGAFARGDDVPLVPGGHSTRSLLLGIEGVLAEGLRFKAGARVVKSVAGFDLPKLFVGSRGRLFAVTLLHLKLRPAPEATRWFSTGDLDGSGALARFAALRRSGEPARALVLRRTGTGAHSVVGCFAGRAAEVERALLSAGATGSPSEPDWRLDAAPSTECVAGTAPLSRLAAVIEALPAHAPLTYTGGGALAVSLAPEETDAVLTRLAALGCAAAVQAGAAHRRGLHTGVDATAARIENAIKAALDPADVLH
jgi:FAD/FMN-containing dehydrogenase